MGAIRLATMRDKLSKGLLILLVSTASVFGVACKDDPVEKKDDVTVAPTRATEVAPSGTLDKLSAPDAVVIYGGFDNVGKMAGHLSELVLGSPAQGALQLESAVSTVALRFGLKDGKALDTSKAVRFAIVDPKANEQPFCVAVGLKSREAFVKSLPDKHKKDDSGNAFSFVTADMKAVFVNYVDDWAVFTGHKEVFGANKAFVVKLIGSSIAGDGGAIVEVGNLTKLYAADLTAALAEMKRNMSQAATSIPAAGGVDKMTDWMMSVVKDLDKVVVTTTASKEAGRLQFDLIAKAGTELEKSLKVLGARKLGPMLSRLPADAPAALVASFDPNTATDLIRGLTAWSMQLTAGKSASEKDYSDAMNAYWKASNGDMAMVTHHFGGEMRVSMLAGLRDAKGADAAMTTLRGMYKEDNLKKLYADMGLSYSFKKGAYKVGKFRVDSNVVKLTGPKGKGKGKAGMSLGGAMGPGGDLFAQMMSHDFSITDDTMISVYGTGARKLMEAWIEGKVTGGLDKAPGMQRALKTAAPGTFFMLYGSPLAVAQAFQNKGAPPPPAGNGLALSAGSTGAVLHVVLDAPADQTKAMMQMFSRLGGGM